MVKWFLFILFSFSAWGQESSRFLFIEPFVSESFEAKLVSDIQKELIKASSIKGHYHIIFGQDFSSYKQIKNVTLHRLKFVLKENNLGFLFELSLYDLVKDKELKKISQQKIPRPDLLYQIELASLKILQKN